MEKEGCDAHSPMDALRTGMTSPLRSFLGLLKPPPLPQIEDESPRSPSVTATEMDSLSCACQTLDVEMGSEVARPGQSVVMVAFDAAVKELSHAGIVWAMENLLKRGDVLAVVSVFDSVRGPLGYRVRVGDGRWMSANQQLVEDEVARRMEAWRAFPGLENRCAEGGVKLVITVKPAQRGEFEICREAARLGAAHVVLDKSLKNRRREVYLRHLACDVTRMRRSGGVEVIRPCAEPRSPTSVIPPPLLSYGDQIDVFEISLGAPKPKRAVASPHSSSSGPELPYSGEIPYSGEMKSRTNAYSGERPSSGELKMRANTYSGELRRLSTSAVLASSFERSSANMSLSMAPGAHARSSSVSAATSSSVQTSSSHDDDTANNHDDEATANDHRDDDLFSIFHGSIFDDDAADQDQLATSGYESDDLFSIGNVSTRRPSAAPALDHSKFPAARSRLVNPCELVVSEPLREATITRITFVVGLGEAVTLSLQDALRPGEGVLVGSSPSALFLTHSGYGAALATATPGSYIAMEGRMAMKLAFLAAGQRVLVVDSLGRGRTVGVKGACTAGAPLVLVEALCEGRRWSAVLHHLESAALCHHRLGTVSVKGLQLGDRVLLRLRSSEPSHAIWSS